MTVRTLLAVLGFLITAQQTLALNRESGEDLSGGNCD